MSEELKPCPFCGSKRIGITSNGKIFVCFCINCKASTNTAARKEDAAYFWNKRAEDLRSNCEALRSNYEVLQGMRWISVNERMPEIDEIVAIRCVTKKGVVTWNRAYWDGKFWHGSGSFAGVTHWMQISTEVEANMRKG